MSYFSMMVQSGRSFWPRLWPSLDSSGRFRRIAQGRRAMMQMIRNNRLTIAMWASLLSLGGVFQWLT